GSTSTTRRGRPAAGSSGGRGRGPRPRGTPRRRASRTTPTGDPVAPNRAHSASGPRTPAQCSRCGADEPPRVGGDGVSGMLLRLVCTAALAAGTVLAPLPAAAVPEPGGAAADAGGRSVAELLTELQTLYRQAEKATEAHNATEERLTKQRAETERLERALARTRHSLHDSRGAAGRLARQQYQSVSGLSPYVGLLLARDPQRVLDQGHVIGQLARERAQTVGRLTGEEEKARALAHRARKALDDRRVLTERSERQRDEVRERLHDVEE